ncbi:MAG: hypothetical protein K2I96_25370 [Lachnospiraceae bacterium]|nr:hypothetical protein [Lachnospiraceae bacterium]
MNVRVGFGRNIRAAEGGSGAAAERGYALIGGSSGFVEPSAWKEDETV